MSRARKALFLSTGLVAFELALASFRVVPGGIERARPGELWQNVAPRDVRLDPAALRDLEEFLGGSGCVVRFGFLAHCWGRLDRRVDVASAGKPLYGHLVMEALERGHLESLDVPVAQHRPDLRHLNPALGYKDSRITWRHMMNQVSGYGVVEDPGEAFCYSDHQTAMMLDTLLFDVLERSESDANDLFVEWVSHPLGCRDHPKISFEPGRKAGRVFISPRDFARFGWLYLHGGRWGEERILPEALVRQATSSPVPPTVPGCSRVRSEMLPGQRTIGSGDRGVEHLNSYSQFWWVNGETPTGERLWPSAPPDAFGAIGHAGRHAMVVLPSEEIVIAWNHGFSRDAPRRFTEDGRWLVDRALGLLGKAVVPTGS